MKNKMKIRTLLGVALLSVMTVGCKETDLFQKVYNQGINIIPRPQEVELAEGRFALDGKTKICIGDEKARDVAAFYADKMRASTGFPFDIVSEEAAGGIVLSLDSAAVSHPEGYVLDVRPQGVKVTAATPQGLFYGMASFVQLLPAEIESRDPIPAAGGWTAPALTVEDAPRFGYRGLMIDVARHFTSVEGMKKHIDMLATLKINRLHLHLSDYQGWRVEIKKYPRLTEIGSRRIDEYGREYGGYYTQEDIRELVRYASERFVTLIPELDVPGHTLAAVASYPEISCTGDTYPVMSRWGRFPVVFCPGKEVMFEMMDGIFAELSTLFPGEYFHIGGDECPKEVWATCPHCQKRIKEEGLAADKEHSAVEKLQSYAIARCEKILHKYGRKMIGWDEILEGGIAPDATVMSWRGESGGIASAQMGHQVIMTPTSGGMYFDYYQGDPQAEPFAWGGYVPISKVYAYNPVPDTLVAMGKDKYVIGVQANAWSECMYTEDLVEYRVYPRVLALAEVGWTQRGQKDFDDFSRRLNNAAVRMDMHGINYHIPLPEQPGGSKNHIAFTDSVSVAFQTSRPMKMVYTLDGSEPGLASAEYVEPLSFTESGEIKIRSVLPSGKMSLVRTVAVERQQPAEALEVTPRNQGVRLKIADTRCLYASELEKVTAWKDSVSNNLEVIARLRPNRFSDVAYYAAVAEGYVYIGEEGVYEFTSNDTRVWVAGRLAVDNDGKPQINSKYGRCLALKKGWHSLKVEQISNFIGGWNSQHRNNGAVSMRKYGEKKWTRMGKELIGY